MSWDSNLNTRRLWLKAYITGRFFGMMGVFLLFLTNIVQ